MKEPVNFSGSARLSCWSNYLSLESPTCTRGTLPRTRRFAKRICCPPSVIFLYTSRGPEGVLPAIMVDPKSSPLDALVQHPFFLWFTMRGKREKAHDKGSLTLNRGGRALPNKKLLNTSSPLSGDAKAARSWDHALPTPIATGVMTAPVSTCSGSTYSRAPSWSDAPVNSSSAEASGMLEFGRLRMHSSSEEVEYAAAPVPVPQPLRLDESSFEPENLASAYTLAAMPIDIPSSSGEAPSLSYNELEEVTIFCWKWVVFSCTASTLLFCS